MGLDVRMAVVRRQASEPAAGAAPMLRLQLLGDQLRLRLAQVRTASLPGTTNRLAALSSALSRIPHLCETLTLGSSLLWSQLCDERDSSALLALRMLQDSSHHSHGWGSLHCPGRVRTT